MYREVRSALSAVIVGYFQGSRGGGGGGGGGVTGLLGVIQSSPAICRRFTGFSSVSLQNPNPQNMAYLYSGYAPLSVKLVELLAKKQGFSAFDEVWYHTCSNSGVTCLLTPHS